MVHEKKTRNRKHYSIKFYSIKKYLCIYIIVFFYLSYSIKKKRGANKKKEATKIYIVFGLLLVKVVMSVGLLQAVGLGQLWQTELVHLDAVLVCGQRVDAGLARWHDGRVQVAGVGVERHLVAESGQLGLELVVVHLRHAVRAAHRVLHLVGLLEYVGQVVLQILDLVQVDLLVLALHLLEAHLHRLHGRLRVAHRLYGHVLLLDVERLIVEHLALILVGLLLLEKAQRLGLDRILRRPFSHLLHLI